MTDKLTLPLHSVSIDRGKEKIGVQVPLHEIRVLRATHGVAEVVDLGEIDPDDINSEIELDKSADAEWARLIRKYKRINAKDPAPLAYPIGPPAMREFGFDLNRGAGVAAPMSGQRKGPKPKKAAKAAK